MTAQALTRRHIEQLQYRVNELRPFSQSDLSVVVVGSWGLQRPNFQLLVLVQGASAEGFNITQRHEWLTMLIDLSRSMGMNLSWQDVRFIRLSELNRETMRSEASVSSLERPISDALLLLVDAVALSNAPLLNLARELVLRDYLSTHTEVEQTQPFVGLSHAIQECWHRMCLQSAVHPEMEKMQFGWRLALHSLVLSMAHFKPSNVRSMLTACDQLALDRIAHVLRLPLFESSWAEEHKQFLEDFQTLMDLRSVKSSGPPVAMSQLVQRRYNRFFYRLLTHPNVDEALRFSLLS